ncbi:signal recognition particle GTPase [Bradyrhizobium sp. LB7.2]
MPRYFFHVHNVAPSKDEQGEELPDDEAAWREATTFAGALFRDVDGKFRPGEEWSLEVMDEAGKPIYFISIGSRKMK